MIISTEIGSSANFVGEEKAIELVAKAGAEAVAKMQNMAFYHDIEVCAVEAMKADVKKAIELFR